jgi:DNA polymerase-3 subunit epsilon
VPADAVAVHGLTAEFLADKPLFGAVADEFLAFIGGAPLVAHNAGFDIASLNAELKRAARPRCARASGRYAGAGAAQACRRQARGASG